MNILIVPRCAAPTVVLPDIEFGDFEGICLAHLRRTHGDGPFMFKGLQDTAEFLLCTRLRELKQHLNWTVDRNISINLWKMDNHPDHRDPVIRSLIRRFHVDLLSYVFTRLARSAKVGKRVVIGIYPNEKEMNQLVNLWCNCLERDHIAPLGDTITIWTTVGKKERGRLSARQAVFDVSLIDFTDITAILKVASRIDTAIRLKYKILIIGDYFKAPVMTAFVCHNKEEGTHSLKDALNNIKTDTLVCCDRRLDALISQYGFYQRMTDHCC